jgi:hypothetical protein
MNDNAMAETFAEMFLALIADYFRMYNAKGLFSARTFS